MIFGDKHSTMAALSFRTWTGELLLDKNFEREEEEQDRAAESRPSLQKVHVCLLIVGWLYLYRNASDALFFVQFYVHASVGF